MKRFFECICLYPIGFGLSVMFAVHATFEGTETFSRAFSHAWTDFKEFMKDDK